LESLGAFVVSLGVFPGFRWVGSERLHITLRFLGDVTADQVMKLDTNLSGLGGRPFDLSLSGVGAYPSLSRVKALWLGVKDGSGQLGRLAALVEKASVSAGCEPEPRRFHPHLTLARARAERGAAPLPDELAGRLSEAPAISWTCDSFTLMRSELAKTGPSYTPMRRYPF
jgi:2'-5' RNA ligase